MLEHYREENEDYAQPEPPESGRMRDDEIDDIYNDKPEYGGYQVGLDLVNEPFRQRLVGESVGMLNFVRTDPGKRK